MRIIDADDFAKRAYEVAYPVVHGLNDHERGLTLMGIAQLLDEQPTVHENHWIPVTECLPEADTKEKKMDDLISRQVAIALADKLKHSLPNDERMADAVIAHNEGILEYQTALSLLPSEQPEIIRCKDCKYMTEHNDTDGNAPY